MNEKHDGNKVDAHDAGADSAENRNPLLSRRALFEKGTSKMFAGMLVGFLGTGMVGSSQKRADALCICACCTGCTGSCTWICSTCTGCTGSCSGGCKGTCTNYCQGCDTGCGEGLCNLSCGVDICDKGAGPGYNNNMKMQDAQPKGLDRRSGQEETAVA
jgi:hypothetical protein